MANQVCIIETDKIVNGTNLMKGNTNLVKWDSDLSSLVNGDSMFYGTELESFSCDLSSLTDGSWMFYYCTSLTFFSGDLSSLVNGSWMFYDTSLTSFSGDLSSLENGSSMFSYTSLESFSGDLSSLTDGSYMFFYTSLESFSGDLSSLVNGAAMFAHCNLNADSVRNIAVTINNEVTNTPSLSLGVNSSILTNTQTKNDFGVIKHKGWNLSVNSSSSYDYTPWSSQKYNGCTTVDAVKAVDSNYITTDIVDGKWTEHLCDLEDGSSMFLSTKLTSFSGDLSSLTNGSSMFLSTKLTSFSGDLSSLTNGSSMFYRTSLTSFSGDLSSLTNGQGMFCYTSLESFSGDLSSLVNGSYMFSSTSLASFSGDLSSLVNGSSMFSSTSLTSFSGDLSSLVNGFQMFYKTSLTSFSGDLSSLVKGGGMFSNTSLESFSSNLSNLTNGYNMFYNCKLNTESIKGISDTIKDVTELTNSSSSSGDIYKRIDIGIGNSSPTTEEQGYLNTIASKGWTVYVNGSAYTPTGVASVMTLDEDGNEVETPIPYYAKPIASDEEHAEYIDADGNYFNIVGAQFIYGDDLSTYGMFTCEEDAAANMRLTKIDK